MREEAVSENILFLRGTTVLHMRGGTKMKRVWTILGGGNGGQSIAGHLAWLGEQVRIYEVVPETVEALTK